MATSTNQEKDNTSILSWSQPYPPTKRDGRVEEHDKPFFFYEHLDPVSIAELRNFSLPKLYESYKIKEKGSKRFKLNRRKLAISGFSHISKEQVFEYIFKIFEKKTVRYVCVASQIDNNVNMPRLNIQIIFYEKKTIYTPFLDKFLDSKCEYQVTIWGDAWNEYLKRGLNFIEYGLFKGSMDNGAEKMWFKPSQQKKTSNTITTELASEAFTLAKFDSYGALCHLVKNSPKRCLSSLKSFDANLDHFRKKTRLHEQLIQSQIKPFIWPQSFPDCTEKLKNSMNEWLFVYFRKPGRPKCLFLVGPTGTGKTSFALSLPGISNHCRGYWTTDRWHDNADYMILDDIPWNEYHRRGFPSPEDLITGQKFLSVNGKYEKIKTIKTDMSAIVLLNPHDATHILKLLDKNNKHPMAHQWRERSFLYVMEDNEYFYKPKIQQNSEKQIIYSVDHLPLFQESYHQWCESQKAKQVDNMDEMDEMDSMSELSEEYPFDG